MEIDDDAVEANDDWMRRDGKVQYGFAWSGDSLHAEGLTRSLADLGSCQHDIQGYGLRHGVSRLDGHVQGRAAARVDGGGQLLVSLHGDEPVTAGCEAVADG